MEGDMLSRSYSRTSKMSKKFQSFPKPKLDQTPPAFGTPELPPINEGSFDNLYDEMM
jgi:hypothetical protein